MLENKPASRWNFRRSLAFRYLLIVSSIFLVGQLLLSTLLGFTTYRQQLQSLITKVTGQSEFLSTVIPEPLLRSDFLLLETLMKQSSQDADIVYSVILNDQGKPITRFLNQENSLIAQALENNTNGTGVLAVIETVRQTSTVREVRVPIVLNGRPLGEVWLGYSIQSVIQDSLRAGATTVAFSLLASALLVWATIILFNRQISAPLQSLTETARALASGDRKKRSVVKRDDEIGSLGNAFNSMADDLQQVLENLEQRVAERTKALATVARVSAATSTILETEKLLPEVVNLAKEEFGLYHAHIYLLNEAGDTLVLTAGAGEAGTQMVSEGRSIPLNREQSLVARAARERQGVIINDVSTALDFLPNPLLPDTRSELAVPLVIGDKVIGVFDVQSDKVDRFTPEDVNIQSTLASQIAVAIQNAQEFTARKQAEEAMAQRAVELATVARVSSATATILDTDKLLLEVVNLTKEQFNHYHSHIYLLNEAGNTLILAAGAGEPGKKMVAEGLSIPLNREQSLVARAARERQGVIVNDVRKEPDFLPNPLLPDTRSELAVPLIVGDRVLGVFDVQSDRVDRFTSEDVNIQSMLASQIAVALQNVRAFLQAQRQAERETTLNVISQKIQGATTVEAVLQIAARELGNALGAPLTIAQLGMKDNSGNNGNNHGSD